MNKKVKENKTKMLCDIMKIIAERVLILDLESKVTAICKQYFPNANEVFINEINILSRIFKNLYEALDDIAPMFNSYRSNHDN